MVDGRTSMPRSPVGGSTGNKWSTWGGAAGEIRCARCGTVRKGSDPHICAIVQQRTPKVETSPMAQTLLRRADTCPAPAAYPLAPTQTDGAHTCPGDEPRSSQCRQTCRRTLGRASHEQPGTVALHGFKSRCRWWRNRPTKSWPTVTAATVVTAALVVTAAMAMAAAAAAAMEGLGAASQPTCRCRRVPFATRQHRCSHRNRSVPFLTLTQP